MTARLLLTSCIIFCSLQFWAQAAIPCTSTPTLNQSIVKFVKANLKKKVGRGECWDLAAAALDKNGAVWDHNYNYGTAVDFKKGECLCPGDILQFEGVLLSYGSGGNVYEERYEHHTAIILEIQKGGSILIAQQNTSESGKKVSSAVINLTSIKKGTLLAFRPHK